MDEQLRAAYDRLDGALEPPGDAVSLVADRVAVRRRRRSLGAVVGSAAAVAVIAGLAWGLASGESSPGPGPTDATPDLVAPSPVETPKDPTPPPTPTALLDVECDGAGWRVGSVVNSEVYPSGSRDAENAIRRWLEDWSTFDLGRVDNDNAVVSLLAPDDRVYASLGLVRIDGWWRVGSASACTSEFPGLEEAEVFGSGLPLVELVAVNEGHCWIETLEYVGRSWDLRNEDQFGWGGPGPKGFLSVGSVKVTNGGQQLDYVDLSGARLEFVPAGSPGTDVNEGICD